MAFLNFMSRGFKQKPYVAEVYEDDTTSVVAYIERYIAESITLAVSHLIALLK